MSCVHFARHPPAASLVPVAMRTTAGDDDDDDNDDDDDDYDDYDDYDNDDDYCSLQCYRSPSHTSCSEQFYKECVTEELRGQEADTESKQRMVDILHRMNSQEEEEEDSDDDEDPLDLAERLQGIDLDDAAETWSALTSGKLSLSCHTSCHSCHANCHSCHAQMRGGSSLSSLAPGTSPRCCLTGAPVGR